MNPDTAVVTTSLGHNTVIYMLITSLIQNKIKPHSAPFCIGNWKMWQLSMCCHLRLTIVTYYPHMPIGMLGIYRLLFVFFLCCRILVMDISGVGWH